MGVGFYILIAAVAFTLVHGTQWISDFVGTYGLLPVFGGGWLILMTL